MLRKIDGWLVRFDLTQARRSFLSGWESHVKPGEVFLRMHISVLALRVHLRDAVLALSRSGTGLYWFSKAKSINGWLTIMNEMRGVERTSSLKIWSETTSFPFFACVNIINYLHRSVLAPTGRVASFLAIELRARYRATLVQQDIYIVCQLKINDVKFLSFWNRSMFLN